MKFLTRVYHIYRHLNAFNSVYNVINFPMFIHKKFPWKWHDSGEAKLTNRYLLFQSRTHLEHINMYHKLCNHSSYGPWPVFWYLRTANIRKLAKDHKSYGSAANKHVHSTFTNKFRNTDKQHNTRLAFYPLK